MQRATIITKEAFKNQSIKEQEEELIKKTVRVIVKAYLENNEIDGKRKFCSEGSDVSGGGPE